MLTFLEWMETRGWVEESRVVVAGYEEDQEDDVVAVVRCTCPERNETRLHICISIYNQHHIHSCHAAWRHPRLCKLLRRGNPRLLKKNWKLNDTGYKDANESGFCLSTTTGQNLEWLSCKY